MVYFSIYFCAYMIVPDEFEHGNHHISKTWHLVHSLGRDFKSAPSWWGRYSTRISALCETGRFFWYHCHSKTPISWPVRARGVSVAKFFATASDQNAHDGGGYHKTVLYMRQSGGDVLIIGVYARTVTAPSTGSGLEIPTQAMYQMPCLGYMMIAILNNAKGGWCEQKRY